MIDYHSQLWNDYRQFDADFISFNTNVLVEPRSDIMKELTYSRQTTNTCSTNNTVFGATNRLLSCTRVEDELLSPINGSKINFDNKNWSSYCYGKNLGIMDKKSLTDNWFCCQDFTTKTPLTNNNPIYNIKKNNF